MEKNEKYYITAYQNMGYGHNYHIENGKLVDLETKNEYTPNFVYIVAEHRFEGMSNPSDMSILYVIETNDGSKGTVLAAYGPANDTALAEFFANVPKGQCSNKVNIDNQ